MGKNNKKDSISDKILKYIFMYIYYMYTLSKRENFTKSYYMTNVMFVKFTTHGSNSKQLCEFQ